MLIPQLCLRIDERDTLLLAERVAEKRHVPLEEGLVHQLNKI